MSDGERIRSLEDSLIQLTEHVTVLVTARPLGSSPQPVAAPAGSTAASGLDAVRSQYLPGQEIPNLVGAGITLQPSSIPRVPANLILCPQGTGFGNWFNLSCTNLEQGIGCSLGFSSSFYQEAIN